MMKLLFKKIANFLELVKSSAKQSIIESKIPILKQYKSLIEEVKNKFSNSLSEEVKEALETLEYTIDDIEDALLDADKVVQSGVTSRDENEEDTRLSQIAFQKAIRDCAEEVIKLNQTYASIKDLDENIANQIIPSISLEDENAEICLFTMFRDIQDKDVVETNGDPGKEKRVKRFYHIPLAFTLQSYIDRALKDNAATAMRVKRLNSAQAISQQNKDIQKAKERDKAKAVGSLYKVIDSEIRFNVEENYLTTGNLKAKPPQPGWSSFVQSETSGVLQRLYDLETPIFNYLKDNGDKLTFDGNVESVEEFYKLVKNAKPEAIEILSQRDKDVVKLFTFNLSQYETYFSQIKDLIEKAIETKAREIILRKYGGKQSDIDEKKLELQTIIEKLEVIIKRYARTTDSIRNVLNLDVIKQLNPKDYQRVQQHTQLHLAKYELFRKLDEIEHYFTDRLDSKNLKIKDSIFMLDGVKILNMPDDLAKLIPNALKECEIILKALNDVIAYMVKRAKDPKVNPETKEPDLEARLCFKETSLYTTEEILNANGPLGSGKDSPTLDKILRIKKAVIDTSKLLALRGENIVGDYDISKVDLSKHPGVNLNKDKSLMIEYNTLINKPIDVAGVTSIAKVLLLATKGELYDREHKLFRSEDIQNLFLYNINRKEIEKFIDSANKIHEEILNKDDQKIIENNLKQLGDITDQFEKEQVPILSNRKEFIGGREGDTRSITKTRSITPTSTSESKQLSVNEKQEKKQKELSDDQLVSLIMHILSEPIVDQYSLEDLLKELEDNNLYSIDGLIKSKELSNMLYYPVYRDEVEKNILEMKKLSEKIKDESVKQAFEEIINKLYGVLAIFDSRDKILFDNKDKKPSTPQVTSTPAIQQKPVSTPPAPIIENSKEREELNQRIRNFNLLSRKQKIELIEKLSKLPIDKAKKELDQTIKQFKSLLEEQQVSTKEKRKPLLSETEPDETQVYHRPLEEVEKELEEERNQREQEE